MSARSWLLTAAALIVAGSLMFTVVMTAYGWDFSKLSTEDFETQTYEITEDFDRVSMDLSMTRASFVLSDDGKCKVESYESERLRHTVDVQNGTLIIDSVDDRSWRTYFGLLFDSPKITIHLPDKEYVSLSIDGDSGEVYVPSELRFKSIDISLNIGDIDIRTAVSDSVRIGCTTGDISVKGLSVKSLDLSVTTGDISVSDVMCDGNIDVSVTTGDVELEDVIATGRIDISTVTGDVEIERSDASEIDVETNTGDVEASLLSGKTFYVSTNKGDVNVPPSVSGGVCRIHTNTGDIHVSIV